MDGCQSRPSPNARAIEAVKAALAGDLRSVRRIAREIADEAREAAFRQFGEESGQDVT